jgi:hypothetical protein
MRFHRFLISSSAQLLFLCLLGCNFQPNPALESKKRALASHPELGVDGSTFNWAFGELYRRLLAEKSQRLLSAEWPMDLASEVAGKLKVAQAVSSDSSPTKTVQTTSSSLNQKPVRANFRWR